MSGRKSAVDSQIALAGRSQTQTAGRKQPAVASPQSATGNHVLLTKCDTHETGDCTARGQ